MLRGSLSNLREVPISSAQTVAAVEKQVTKVGTIDRNDKYRLARFHPLRRGRTAIRLQPPINHSAVREYELGNLLEGNDGCRRSSVLRKPNVMPFAHGDGLHLHVSDPTSCSLTNARHMFLFRSHGDREPWGCVGGR